MSDIRASLQKLADAITSETGANDGVAEMSIERISVTLPQKLGEGGMLVVTVTDGEAAGTYVADASAADIYAAYKEGKTVVAVYDRSEPGHETAAVYNLLDATCNMGWAYDIRFGNLTRNTASSGGKQVSEMIFDNNGVSIQNHEFVAGDQIISFMATLIAQPYNSHQTYSKGDLVLVHVGQTAIDTMLYECLQNVATPEEFNFSHWHVVDIATILKRIPVA